MLLRPERTLVLVAAAAIAAGLALLAAPAGLAVAAPAALALVLLLPGLAFTTVAFGPGTTGLAERILYVGASSVAISMITGLVLDRLPWGLRRESWAVALAAVTVAIAVVGVYRMRTRPARRPTAVRLPTISRRNAVLFGAAAVIGVAGVLRAVAGAADAPQTRFVQMWMLPKPGTAAVTIGVTNRSGAAIDGRVELRAGAETIATWQAVSLVDGATWEIESEVPIARTPPGVALDAVLQAGGATTPLTRHVTLYRTFAASSASPAASPSGGPG